jgi:hypothetical protein
VAPFVLNKADEDDEHQRASGKRPPVQSFEEKI